MNSNDFELISTEKIGANCLYEAVSCILEYTNKLYYALEYTNSDFIFNNKVFVTYDRYDVENYISDYNKLFFRKDPNSMYRVFYNNYLTHLFENSEIYKCFCNYKYNTKNINFKDLNDKFIKYNIPVVISVDTYYLKDEYAKYNLIIDQGHNYHFIVIYNIDEKQNICRIIDKHFRFKGSMPIDKLKYAFNNIEKDRGVNVIWYLDIPLLNKLSKNSNIHELIKKNISFYLLDDIYVNKIRFSKNVKALSDFISYLPDIMKHFEDVFVYYAPQHISFPLVWVYWQKRSVATLYNYILEVTKTEQLEKISMLMKNSQESWSKFDMLLDKIYLKNKLITEYEERLIDLLNNVLEIEKKLQYQMYISLKNLS